MNAPESHFVVAIDGPAGAGKSTVARALASRLGYTFLDTGAIYRSVALLTREQGISWTDGARAGAIATAIDVSFASDGAKTRVLANGLDVTDAIRHAEISEGASQVSALPEVRAGLLDAQRRVASHGSVVAEGRDVGTVVFPSARAKFFLVASPETRARRRMLELAAAGRPATFEAVLADMATRDARDSQREVAPLRKAQDAIEIDSSALTPEQVIEHMLDVVRSRGG
jgi:cytidylate kinase